MVGGKRDEKLILPTNDSLSVTLNSDDMCARTTVQASPDLESDRLWLNGQEEDLASNARLQNCLGDVRKLATEQGKDSAGWKVHIKSENNFPTAAGLASSAAGYACLGNRIHFCYICNFKLIVVCICSSCFGYSAWC